MLSLLTGYVYAEDLKKREVLQDLQNISITTRQESFFPAGDQALYKRLLNVIINSQEARNSRINEVLALSFDANPGSNLSNWLFFAGPGFGINEQVKNILAHLKFALATQNGSRTQVNMMMNFPVSAY